VDPDLEVSTQTDTPVSQVILKALAPYGFDRISTDGTEDRSALTGKTIKGGALPFPVDTLKHQQAKAQEGETAYQFCSRIFSRLGVCLRMKADGQLLISAPDYDQQPSYTLVQDPTRKVDGDYFIGEIKIHDTNEGQFSEARCRGERDENNPDVTQTARPEYTVKATDLNAQFPSYSADVAAAGYKPYIMRDKNARDVKRCKNVATMALGLKGKDAYTIEGEVDGFRAKTGALWQVNTTAHVYIAEEGINAKMWISDRTFTQDRTGGQKTRVKKIPLGALVLGELPKG
jgi:prophage tail gpP-like protein